MLSNVISFVSSVESKSILEIFICDIAFCCSFIMVRVVRLSFLWLLHVPTWILKIEYVITVSSLLVNSSISLCWWSFHHRLLLHIHIVKREFTVSWSDAEKTFTFTLTNSIGSILFMICPVKLIFCSCFLVKTTAFGLILENLVYQNSVFFVLVFNYTARWFLAKYL